MMKLRSSFADAMAGGASAEVRRGGIFQKEAHTAWEQSMHLAPSDKRHMHPAARCTAHAPKPPRVAHAKAPTAPQVRCGENRWCAFDAWVRRAGQSLLGLRRGRRPPPVSDDVEAAARRIAWLMELRNMTIISSDQLVNGHDRGGMYESGSTGIAGMDRFPTQVEERRHLQLTASAHRSVKMSDDDMEDCESLGKVCTREVDPMSGE